MSAGKIIAVKHVSGSDMLPIYLCEGFVRSFQYRMSQRNCGYALAPEFRKMLGDNSNHKKQYSAYTYNCLALSAVCAAWIADTGSGKNESAREGREEVPCVSKHKRAV